MLCVENNYQIVLISGIKMTNSNLTSKEWKSFKNKNRFVFKIKHENYNHLHNDQIFSCLMNKLFIIFFIAKSIYWRKKSSNFGSLAICSRFSNFHRGEKWLNWLEWKLTFLLVIFFLNRCFPENVYIWYFIEAGWGCVDVH